MNLNDSEQLHRDSNRDEAKMSECKGEYERAVGHECPNTCLSRMSKHLSVTMFAYAQLHCVSICQCPFLAADAKS